MAILLRGIFESSKGEDADILDLIECLVSQRYKKVVFKFTCLLFSADNNLLVANKGPFPTQALLQVAREISLFSSGFRHHHWGP